jgi:carbonic anhydrase
MRAEPALRLAVVTCMDVRLDVLAILGLRHGDAHVLRNAGGRVTDDVLRSLTLSSHLLAARDVIVMQHTDCGVAGRTEDELRARTGAEDVTFHAIDDHEAAIRSDVERIRQTPHLSGIETVSGLLHDVATGATTDVVHVDATARKQGFATMGG